MLNIIDFGRSIKYTKGDTFELLVSTDGTYGDGTVLELQIAENENSDILINHAEVMKRNAFVVRFSEEEKEKLELGDYIYRLRVLQPEGGIQTQLSGEFSVVWGSA